MQKPYILLIFITWSEKDERAKGESDVGGGGGGVPSTIFLMSYRDV
jgi:hypothetical protein